MKKRFITVILAAAMCLSLAACDKKADNTDQSSATSQEEVSSSVNSDVVTDTSSAESSSVNTDTSSIADATSTAINLAEYTKNSDGVYNLTKEQALKFAKRVQLTNDNWQEYFDNREKEEEYKPGIPGMRRYFGVANNYDIVIYNNVSFKVKKIVADDSTRLDNTQYKTFELRDDGVYLSQDGAEFNKLDNGTDESFFTRNADFNDDDSFSLGGQYYDIQSASGEVILMDIPDELWSSNDGAEYNICIEGHSIRRDAYVANPNEEVYNLLFN